MALKHHLIDSVIHNAGRPNAKARQILVTLVHSLISHHELDLIVVLAGVNDIAAGAMPEEVLAILRHIFSRACSQSQLLILHLLPINSSPEFTSSHPLYKQDDLNELNTLIDKWSKSEEASKCMSPPIVLDLSGHYITPTNRTLFSDDVHLSTTGYDLLGSLIADAIIKIIQPPPPPLIE